MATDPRPPPAAADVIHVDVRDPADELPAPPGDPVPGVARTLDLKVRLLDENDRQASANRTLLGSRGIRALNFVSAPGSGKTTLLQRTLAALESEIRCAVLVGDLETDNDARRLRRPGLPVAQITTGSACHLDASMIARGLAALPLEGVRLLFIENVGNLVCPASFDLGENRRVVLLSCTEGEDKPLKYPPMFASAHAVLLTKTDLAAAAGFDLAAARAAIKRAAPQAAMFELSARTGEGFDAWLAYLRALL
ncbi:hydrogenase nickel incorporation protein HypB [Opitutus terrae]|uniref:Hydrogenase accessory protein HypB n=1 Tax=Opitutus terrae (strain DSM 11246 / JCM 15787 / PB90-1) TaxID=452637 RepID=B1ZQ63_OPITP|nr:hydrogenase nickel incorporation protein HypB [Opitutus terrae]ACB77784.1 hydrogenase accessory protein HypB [Opitutus terrae PB90-1]